MKKAESYITLQNELDVFRKLMTQAAKVISDKDVSSYPIMVAHQQELELGMPIFVKEENKGSKWSIHASTLEEFVTKQIIFPEKVEEFKGNYKSSSANICVFVLSELGAEFIFLPVKE
jgi:phage pi2 protein 07